MKERYVVIGAGIAGMTTALVLARCGHAVTLVERAPRCAPLVRGFRRDGCYFDSGFHYAGGLGAGGIFTPFLDYLGLSDRLRLTPFDPLGFDRCRFAAGSDDFRFPVGEAALTEALVAVFPAERPAIVAYLQAVRGALDGFPYLNLAQPFAAGGYNQLDGPSLRQVLDELTDCEPLKGLLSLHCLLHGAAPTEIPFALHAVIVGPYYRAVHGVDGGGEGLARAFEAALAAAGVELRLGVAVERLLFTPGGEVRGVQLAGGEELDCRGCVATLHPRLLLEMVPPGVLRPAYRHRIERLEESAGAMIVYAACDGGDGLLRGANLFLSPEPGSPWNLTGGPIEGRPFYLTACDQTIGEAGGFLGICPLAVDEVASWRESHGGRRPPAYVDFKARLLERLQERIRRQAPELAGSLRVICGSTPLTYQDYVGSPFGSLYGVKHRVGQINPQPQTRAGGLFLAGQAVAAPGVTGAMLSGFLAAGAIVGHDLLREDIKRWH